MRRNLPHLRNAQPVDKTPQLGLFAPLNRSEEAIRGFPDIGSQREQILAPQPVEVGHVPDPTLVHQFADQRRAQPGDIHARVRGEMLDAPPHLRGHTALGQRTATPPSD